MSEAWHSGSDTRWRVFRAAVLQRDHYRCKINGPGCTTHALLRGGHVDHIVPLDAGGAKYDMANARAACARCNTSRRRAFIPQPAARPVSRWA